MCVKIDTKSAFRIDNLNLRNIVGFTLIEICIVLVIIGLLMSATLAMMKASEGGREDRTTKFRIEKAQDALKSYYAMNGAFPCPASRTAAKGTSGFGKALENCTQPPSIIALDKETISVNGRGDRGVRLGLLPFRSLGISDVDSVDGYGNLLQYAVTESLTQPESYNQKDGAIDIVAEDEQSRVMPPGSVQYVVYSTGQDSLRGYTAKGKPTGLKCPINTLQTENCDDDAVFMEAEETYNPNKKSGVNMLYDDKIAYFQHEVPKAISGGMVLPYVSTCPKGFTQVEANGLKIIDGEPLTLYPKFGQKYNDNMFSKVVFCHTSEYSITITIVEDQNRALSKCPDEWQNIGYKAINPFSSNDNKFNYKVCAK